LDIVSSGTIGIVAVICSQIISIVEATNGHGHEEHLTPEGLQ